MMVKYKFLSSAEGDNVKYYKYKIGPGGSPASFEECQEVNILTILHPFPCDYTEYSISAPPSVPIALKVAGLKEFVTLVTLSSNNYYMETK